MNYMDTEGTIATIVEAMLPRFSSPVLGLNMILEIIANDPNADKDARRYLHLLFIRPSNYTKVFTRVIGDRGNHCIGREIEFKLMSDHDSCWRSDGLSQMFQLLRECCNEIDPEAPFAKLCPSVKFCIFRGGPKYVEVYKAGSVLSFRLDEDERYGKKPIKLKLKRQLTVQEAGAFMPKEKKHE